MNECNSLFEEMKKEVGTSLDKTIEMESKIDELNNMMYDKELKITELNNDILEKNDVIKDNKQIYNDE